MFPGQVFAPGVFSPHLFPRAAGAVSVMAAGIAITSGLGAAAASGAAAGITISASGLVITTGLGSALVGRRLVTPASGFFSVAGPLVEGRAADSFLTTHPSNQTGADSFFAMHTSQVAQADSFQGPHTSNQVEPADSFQGPHTSAKRNG
jgi:hypothetical protein